MYICIYNYVEKQKITFKDDPKLIDEIYLSEVKSKFILELTVTK